MLDKNALAQLQSLKKEIHDSVPRFSGRVRASNGRFGFVNTDDNQSFFLTPDEMEKVLPGDVVEFRVEPAGEGKEQAIVEKLLNSDIREFFGTYVVRGKGHFIEADHPTLNRWIFVPPAKRNNAVPGDLVKAHISQHPFPQGKAQADIDAVLGNPAEAGIEQRFTLAKWALPDSFSAAVQAETEALVNRGLDSVLTGRTDLSHLPFVTIDSASTRDIDDALFAEAHSAGWTLWVGIADPSALIAPGSELDKAAAERGTSVYLPDLVIPMLPPELSEQLCSLQAGELRPAMVAELRIGEDGSIQQLHLHEASIRSQAKLSYHQVAQFIAGDEADISAELRGPLLHLHHCAQALANWRKTHCLIIEDRPDYKLVFDDNGKVKDIVRMERNAAHRLVEECMLACNRSVAGWLAAQNTGFFIEHGGVRTERHGEVAALLKEQLGLEQKPELHSLAEYVNWLQRAEQAASELPLRMIISRQQERSNLSLEAKPHKGLGFEFYTTFSSPLRKYNDLLIHRIVRELLQQQTPTLPDSELLLSIQAAQTNARLAANQAEAWLKLQWLQQLQHENTELLFDASIVHMNSASMTVRLEDCGIEGSIDRRKAGKEWTFDTKTISHHSDAGRFVLGQPVRVKVLEVQPQARIARFALV